MTTRSVIVSVFLAAVAAGARAQTTNWSPKPPPRAYTARVQMHYVPLRETIREREELHTYDIPMVGSENANYRARASALYEQSPDAPRPVSRRSGRKDADREKSPLPKEKTGVRALLADDETRDKKVSPWDGLDGREMSRRMAEREWRLSHPGEAPGPELARAENGAHTDEIAGEDDGATAYLRDDIARDRAPGVPALSAAAYEVPSDRFGRIAREFVNGSGFGSIDTAALKPADFDEVVRRFEDLQKQAPAFAAHVPEAPSPPSSWRSESVGLSAASVWGESGMRAGREGAFAPLAGSTPFQLSGGSGGLLGTTPQFTPDFRPTLGGTWASPLEAQRPQPATGGPEGFKKPATLPW